MIYAMIGMIFGLCSAIAHAFDGGSMLSALLLYVLSGNLVMFACIAWNWSSHDNTTIKVR